MRRIYLLASPDDRAAVEAFSAYAKQRGYQVRMPAIAGHYPPAFPGEVTVAFWSRALMMSSGQILFANRAIDAWSEGQLVLARLDHAFLPRGLTDIEAIDLTFEQARPFSFQKVIDAALSIDRRPREAAAIEPGAGSGGASATDEDRAVTPKPAPPAPARKHSKPGIFGWIFGSTKRAGASDRPADPAPRAEEVATRAPAAPAPSPPEASDVVFVSYARTNSDVVYPLVETVESLGRTVWIDRNDIQAGDNWAMLIVRAIRSAETFCLMCSAEAFNSDHVRRELYLADKYKRPMLPVRLDATEPPEDFEYFLIDRQWLDLSGLAPGDQLRRLQEIFKRADG